MLSIKKFVAIAIIILFLSNLTSGQIIEKETTDEKYDYIIFTSFFLKNSIKELVDCRESQGFNVKIITEYKNSEQIRNFLKSKYVEWDIKYVLIVGSYNTIPMKYCWPDKEYHKPLILERLYGMPTDHYYAELTHNWDLDRDGYFGEFEDDIVNNSDLNPEICVGRIPFDNPLKVKRFCTKLINYEKSNEDWKTKALFLSSIQEYKDAFIDNAELAEKLQNELFLTSGFNCTKLYEAEGVKPTNYTYDLPLNHINVIKTWRKGYGFVSIIGRGGSRYAMRNIWSEDDGNEIPDKNDTFEIGGKYIVRSFDKFLLDKNKPSIVYSFTCYTAQNRPFSLCSSLMDSAAVVFIGPSIGNSGGWQLKYNFTKYFTSTNMRLGDAFFKAKEEHILLDGGIDNIYMPVYLNNMSVMWTILNTNFYGDPATLKFLPEAV